MNYTKSMANGIPLTINNYDNYGRDGETDARRLAASLPRGSEHIREVENAPLGVDVWINPPEDGESMASYRPVDGFSIGKVSHFDDGTICVRYEVDE